MMGAVQLSSGVNQHWADFDENMRRGWYANHGEEMALAHGALVGAIESYAATIKRTEAHDLPHFSTERFLSDILDAACGHLAPEVQAYLGID